MQTNIIKQLLPYPISISEVESKIVRKNGRKNGLNKTQLPLLASNWRYNLEKIYNDFGEKILRVEGEIPVDLPIEDGNRFLFISHDQTSMTHGLHKYPAKFFPELPRWIISRYSKEKDFILDPFAGSGTTNVEALLLKRNSVGIDVDPFSKYLSRVKTNPVDEKELIKAKYRLLELIVQYRPSKVSVFDVPVFPYRDNWFNREIISELAYIKKAIESLVTDSEVKDFFKICFSSIIRSVSNADDNCTRTVIRKKLNKKVCPADALKKFTEAILFNIPKMIEFSHLYPPNIKVIIPNDMDARDIKFEDNVFDLAVTSPPYVNAVDYPRTHQLELYWLGLAKDSLAPLKKCHIGTESVSSLEYKNLHLTGIKEADFVISRIFKKDPRRAFIVYKYLLDMRKNLFEVFRVLKKGGRYIIVIGNNRIRGEVIENWRYISKLAQGVGFCVENFFASEIIRHFIKVPRKERVDTDWILVLRK